MSGNHRPGIARSIAHLLAALFSDRSKFEREWRAYSPPAPTPNDIQGRWLGKWRSEANGHHGELKCILERSDDGNFTAGFHAVYGRVLRVCYHVPLQARESSGGFKLEGQVDLGRLAGGVYHYSGEATPAEFQCDYRCEYDHGTFRMSPLNRVKS